MFFKAAYNPYMALRLWQATRYPNHCPDYYGQEFMFYSGRSSFLFSCNDLILYTLISRVNPPPWTTTHRGPNVVGGDGRC